MDQSPPYLDRAKYGGASAVGQLRTEEDRRPERSLLPRRRRMPTPRRHRDLESARSISLVPGSTPRTDGDAAAQAARSAVHRQISLHGSCAASALACLELSVVRTTDPGGRTNASAGESLRQSDRRPHYRRPSPGPDGLRDSTPADLVSASAGADLDFARRLLSNGGYRSIDLGILRHH
jgi:hypothetical protein